MVSDESKKIANATIKSDGYKKIELYSSLPSGAMALCIRKLSYKDGIFFQTDTSENGSSITYTQNGFYKHGSGTTGYREWIAYTYIAWPQFGYFYINGTRILGQNAWSHITRLTPNSNREAVTS